MRLLVETTVELPTIFILVFYINDFGVDLA
jgi:hypothetical protein